MHSILFALSKPGDDQEKLGVWNQVVTNLSHIAKTSKTIDALGKGAWLCREADGLKLLGQGIEQATTREIPYRVLIIEEATDWTPGADAKKTA